MFYEKTISATPLFTFTKIHQAVACSLLMGLYASTALAVPSVAYQVNASNDANDIAPGDGVCNTGNTPPPGHTYQCTLRAAVQESNAHYPNSPSAPDIINLPTGTYTLTISGSMENNAVTGDLDIKDHLTINGAGDTVTIVNANNLDRGFQIPMGITATINGLTVKNGTASYSYYPEGHGGGIFNEGTLNLNQASVDSNYAVYEGGGVYNFGTLNIQDSRVVYNTGAGGISNQGNGRLTVNNSVIAGNASGGWFVAGMGGGIRSFGIALTVTNTLIAGNTATRDGGGMYFGGFAKPFIQNVTISGNSANRYGGGIHARNKAQIESLTITNNYAQQNGGGLYVFNSSSGSNAIVTLHNTIVAGNTKGWSVVSDCAVPPSESGSGTNYAQLQSYGYNIDQDNSCNLTATGDQPATNPQLGPLTNTTHPLLSGSPAIDTADPVSFPSTDQRGVSRPQDGNGDGTARADIGAREE